VPKQLGMTRQSGDCDLVQVLDKEAIFAVALPVYGYLSASANGTPTNRFFMGKLGKFFDLSNVTYDQALFESTRIFLVEGWYRLALETYLMLMLEPPLNVKDLGSANKEKYLEKLRQFAETIIQPEQDVNDSAHLGSNYPT
jgi:hypothetical protein